MAVLVEEMRPKVKDPAVRAKIEAAVAAKINPWYETPGQVIWT